jgi:hypothetical protein
MVVNVVQQVAPLAHRLQVDWITMLWSVIQVRCGQDHVPALPMPV